MTPLRALWGTDTAGNFAGAHKVSLPRGPFQGQP